MRSGLRRSIGAARRRQRTIAKEKPNRPVTRFRLVSKRECSQPSVVPRYPGDLIRTQRERTGVSGNTHGEQMGGPATAASLDAAWRVRLSRRDCIQADRVSSEPTLVIRDSFVEYPREQNWGFDWAWTFAPRPVTTRRLDILDSTGRVRFRRSFTSTKILGWPLRPGIVGSKGPVIPFPVFGWWRDTLRSFAADDEYRVNRFLLDHTNLTHGLAVPVGQDTAAELRRVLDDPSAPASDPVFSLADDWMRALRLGKVTDAEKALLVDLVGDGRVTAFQGIWRAVRALGPDATILADPIRSRIAWDYDRRSVVRPLSAQLSAVSAPALGPSSEELAILSDPEKRLDADGVIIRQADYGAKSVPLLMRIMREHVARRELNPVDAVMVALCRIGPEAKAAVPELRALRSSWLSRHLSEDRYWQFTLARIGTPLNEVTPPEGLNMDSQRYADHLRYRLNDFNAQRDCKESWI